ncbi:MAG: hypothetical protein SGJ21_09015 [Alphaproteobacteria bacterium]|mgnify:CR=1 FL=1|nr:hypothetical protein [Alphaproteobacteria bacterium]
MTSRRLSAAALTGLSVLPMLLILPFRASLPDPVLLAAVVLGAGATLVIGGVGWKRLDETAREAHKSAWFWGASFGLLALLIVLAGFLLTPGGPGLLDRVLAALRSADAPWSPTASAFAVGAMSVAVIQTLAYGLLWSLWWLRRR